MYLANGWLTAGKNCNIKIKLQTKLQQKSKDPDERGIEAHF